MASLIRTIRGQPSNKVDGKTSGIRTIRGQVWPVVNQTAASGGSSLALAGAIDAASSITGDVKINLSLSGTISASSTVAGAVRQGMSLSGAIAAESSVAGNAAQASAIAGAVNATSSVSGNLAASMAVAGTIGAVSDIAGDLVDFLVEALPLLTFPVMRQDLTFIVKQQDLTFIINAQDLTFKGGTGTVYSFEKQPHEKYSFEFDFSERVTGTDTIASKTVTAIKLSDGTDATSTVISSSGIDGDTVDIVVQAGTNGEAYKITCLATTAAGQVHEGDCVMLVVEK